MSKLKYKNILLILTLVFIYIIFLLYSLDPDMFFEIATGNDILNGNFKFNSYTQLPIVVQQWLYAVILAIIDNNFGFIGDILFVLIQNIILVSVTYKFLYRKTNNKFLSLICPIILTLLSHIYIINIRPQIITMVILVIEINILDLYKETNNWKYLLYLIPLMILYANLHQAVFLYSIYVSIPYIIDRKIDFKLVITDFCIILCSLCTPYGLDGFMYIFNTFTSKVFTKVSVLELSTVNIKSFNGIVVILMLLIIILLNYCRKSNKFINFYGITLFILVLTSVRHSSIIYIPLLFISIKVIKNLENIEILDFKYILAVFILTGIISISCVITFQPIKSFCNEYEFVQGLQGIDFPKDANIYNTINIGSFLEYYGYNTYIDMRPELYTKKYNNNRIDIYRYIEYSLDENNNVVSNMNILNKLSSFDYVISYNNSKLNVLLEENNFNKIYNTEYYTLWNIK